jgi:hypothetical protein
MTRIEQFLGKACDGCRLCRYARDNPATMIGKIMVRHGKWCPALKAQCPRDNELLLMTSALYRIIYFRM